MDHREDSCNPTTHKYCATCGRRFQWRRKWARDWASVKYCSKGCRSRPLLARTEQVEASIIDYLAVRSGFVDSPSLFRHLKSCHSDATDEIMKSAARHLAHRGQLSWYQRGRRVDPSTCAGVFLVKKDQASREKAG